MNYVAYAFSVDFAKYPLNGGVKHVIEYLPFVTLAVAGPFLRLAAWTLQMKDRWLRAQDTRKCL